MLDQITPVILTYNEAPNIGRTLNALTWAERVVVMDSFSDDDTQKICQQYPNVDFVQRKFDQHAKQWKAAISQNISTPWILALDADYVVSEALTSELKQLNPRPEIAGYRTSFIYKIDGTALRGALYPPVTTLYRAQGADYKQDGHTQRVLLNGEIGTLTSKIFHDDRKSAARWHQSQRNYAKKEADKIKHTRFVDMGMNDKIRFLGLGPVIVIPYTLLAKGVMFDGWAGLKYTWQRCVAEVYLLRARFR